MRIVYTDEMRTVDGGMIERGIPGIVLMENAAFGIAQRCLCEGTVYALCATGNNGGDGLAVVRQLLANGRRAVAVLIGDPDGVRGDAAINLNFLRGRDELIIVNDGEGLERALMGVGSDDVIVDALFGTGLGRPIDGLYAHAVGVINGSKARVVSVDIPSGINGDTGKIMGCAVKAGETVTMQYPKPGHFLFPGAEYTGRLSVVKIGIDDRPAENTFEALSSRFGATLPKRRADSHKGTFGRVSVFCGDLGYTGAGTLCVNAAVAAGAGVVHAVVPRTALNVYSKKLVTPVIDAMDAVDDVYRLLDGKNALCIGPGLGTGAREAALAATILSIKGIKKCLDADALNIIAEHEIDGLDSDTVVTPHPKEFSRLTGIPVADVLADPISAATGYSRRTGACVLLKGATTVVAHGDAVCLVRAGTPGMAKGGSGDVLAGVIGSLLAQGFTPYDAARFGAYICGLAGEKAAKKYGERAMDPSHTLKCLRKVIKDM